jgi:hypothetical protein
MGQNMQLILANAPKAENWEDQERATNDVQTLTEEFNKWFYLQKEEAPQNGEATGTQKTGDKRSM